MNWSGCNNPFAVIWYLSLNQDEFDSLITHKSIVPVQKLLLNVRSYLHSFFICCCAKPRNAISNMILFSSFRVEQRWKPMNQLNLHRKQFCGVENEFIFCLSQLFTPEKSVSTEKSPHSVSRDPKLNCVQCHKIERNYNWR